MFRKQSPHLMARILTNLLQKSSRNRLASQKKLQKSRSLALKVTR